MATRYDRVRPAAGSRGVLIGFGIFAIIVGALMLFLPGLATVAVTVIVGWVLAAIGVAGIIVGAKSPRPSRRWADIGLGLLSLLLGLYALFYPLSGAISLALVAAVWLLVRAVVEGTAAFNFGSGRKRGAYLLAAALDLILGLLLLFNFPFPAVQLVGIAIGVSILVSGVMAIIAGQEAKQL